MERVSPASAECPPGPEPGAEWLEAAGSVVKALGTSGFNASFLSLVNRIASIDQAVVFRIRQHRWTSLFSYRCRAEHRMNHTNEEYVQTRAYLADPMFLKLADDRSRPVRRGLLAASDISDEGYRRKFFDPLEVGEKLSVLEGTAADGLYINLYRFNGRTPFAAAETQHLVLTTSFLRDCLTRHHELLGAAGMERKVGFGLPSLSQALAGRFPELTGREVDTCARYVMGYSTEAIALTHGISISSVITYRRRAYAKLRISSKSELFALCFDAMSAVGSSGAPH